MKDASLTTEAKGPVPLWDFWNKHAMPPKVCPSCLVCGQTTNPAEAAITHLELPGIVVCRKCRDAANAPEPSELLMNVKRAADALVAHIGCHGEINAKHPKVLDCLEALNASGLPGEYPPEPAVKPISDMESALMQQSTARLAVIQRLEHMRREVFEQCWPANWLNSDEFDLRERLSVIYGLVSPSPETKPATEPCGDVSRTFVSRLCNAYESGYGRGQSGRDLAQPYNPASPEGVAYHEGWTLARHRLGPSLDAAGFPETKGAEHGS